MDMATHGDVQNDDKGHEVIKYKDFPIEAEWLAKIVPTVMGVLGDIPCPPNSE